MSDRDSSLGPIFPPAIRRIAVIAPAGPPDAVKLAAGLDELKREGIEILQAPRGGACGTAGYLAADLSDRAAECNRAIRDERVQLVLCARGGFGSVQLLDLLDWDTLRARNLPLAGYSDVTALHAGMLAKNAGIPVAGPMVLKMPGLAHDAFSRATLRIALGAVTETFPAPPELPLQLGNGFPGETLSAKPFAANLTVLCSLCGTPYFPDLTGRLLILEDVNEPLYKIDRMLTQLALCGVFGKIAALAFGDFTGVPFTGELEALLRRTAQAVRGPVWSKFRFGHDLPMTAVNARQTWILRNGVVQSVAE